MTKGVFIHKMAICESTEVGERTRIWGFSHVQTHAKIGRDCNIGGHVFVENRAVIGNGCTIKNGVSIWDGVRIEDGAFIGPNVTFTNDLKPRSFIKRGMESFLPTTINRGASVGANATLLSGITIGEFAMVGAGSVVTKDIPAHTLVVGNPARPIARICYCAESLEKDDYCPACKKKLSENSAEMAAKAFSNPNVRQALAPTEEEQHVTTISGSILKL